MRGRVVSAVIRCPSFSTASASQLDGFCNLVRRPADGDNSVVSEVRPDFVGVWKIERFARIPTQSFRHLAHFTGTQIHRDETPVCLPRNKETLPFNVHR